MLNDLKLLEKKIDGMLRGSKYFKSKRVSEKSIFEIQLLRAKIVSKSESSKAIQVGLLFLGIFLTININIILRAGIDKNYMALYLAILLFIAFGTYLIIDRIFRKSVEKNTYCIELMDLLIEKKEENCNTIQNE
ncbi:hypothetical protein [Sporosarcina obsidiansis]|uniref:hypothetical protein n=1 Tax=Sporosarcina obsidiansis TaxID=2660748 RepID=UPI00129C0ED9|nr:hypothetical protein [Sporosarcina obsidiansis]